MTLGRVTATDDSALRLAASLEAASEHPIAQAIATGARQRTGELPPVGDFANVEGLGVQGTVADGEESRAVIVGRVALEGGARAATPVQEGVEDGHDGQRLNIRGHAERPAQVPDARGELLVRAWASP